MNNSRKLFKKLIKEEGEEKAKNGGTWLKCKSGYYVNKKYMEFVRYA